MIFILFGLARTIRISLLIGICSVFDRNLNVWWNIMQLFAKCKVDASAISVFPRLPDQTLRISKKKKEHNWQHATSGRRSSLNSRGIHLRTWYIRHILSGNVHLATHSDRSVTVRPVAPPVSSFKQVVLAWLWQSIQMSVLGKSLIRRSISDFCDLILNSKYETLNDTKYLI